MDIEDSSVPYREFLRSGSYPALSQRVLRSGGVLAQAAGWFALVLTAASAGYTLTQRLSTPPSAAAGRESLVRPAPRPALASSLSQPFAMAVLEGAPNTIVPEPLPSSERRAPAADKALSARKRTGMALSSATAAAEAEPARAAVPSVEVAPAPIASPPVLAEPERTEQIAERVRALDTATEAAPEPAPAPALPDPIEAVLRDSIERQRAAAAARPVEVSDSIERQRAASAVRPVVVAAKPPQPERVARPSAPGQPLVAAARLDAVNVRGPLSAAQLRRSVDRLRPMLSECYAEAAQRAGHNRYAQVRVTVTIDEAGRVKNAPNVEGAQLPGFAGCLSSALSKLVCQAPDTGTARATLVLGFTPER